MKTLYSILFISFLLILNACSDDWLKPDPLSFYAPEKVFVDEAGFQSALNRCRWEMNGDNHGPIQFNFIAVDHLFVDLATSLYMSDMTLNTPNVAQVNSGMFNIFNMTFQRIKDANTIISRIDNITWSDDRVRNRILGEALWFRAYWYYRLVHSFGDIPWIGEEVIGARTDYVSTSRWAILEQLQKDMEFAAEYLPVTAAKSHVTKGAANHLLTKIYLANCEFDKAIASATAIINGPYELMTQRFGSQKDRAYYNLLWDLHRPDNKSLAENTETIYASVDRADQPFSTWYITNANTNATQGAASGNYGTWSMRAYSPGYWQIPDSQGPRACNWNTASGDTLGIGDAQVRTNNWFHYTIWKEGGYDYSNTPDLRRAYCNWIEMGEEYCEQITAVGPNATDISVDFGKPLQKSWMQNLNDTIYRWYSWPYYKVYNPHPQHPGWSYPAGGPGDWYVFRLAETYLLRAEAYWWKGQTGPAADDINRVRTRAQAVPITSADVDIDYIFDERARELYTEEPRHSEMVRVSFMFAKLNREGYTLESIVTKNWLHNRVHRVNSHYSTPPVFTWNNNSPRLDPHHFLWAIPQSVITANTQGAIKQNYGYDGYDPSVPVLETIP